MKPFNQGLFRYQNQNQNRRGDGAGVSSPPSPRCPCALRLIRSPLSFPRCPCSPRRQGCPSWPSPPPPRLTRSPSSFSRPKKTGKRGLWQGHVTAEPRAGGGPRGLRLGWGDLTEAAPQSGVRLSVWLPGRWPCAQHSGRSRPNDAPQCPLDAPPADGNLPQPGDTTSARPSQQGLCSPHPPAQGLQSLCPWAEHAA